MTCLFRNVLCGAENTEFAETLVFTLMDGIIVFLMGRVGQAEFDLVWCEILAEKHAGENQMCEGGVSRDFLTKKEKPGRKGCINGKHKFQWEFCYRNVPIL